MRQGRAARAEQELEHPRHQAPHRCPDEELEGPHGARRHGGAELQGPAGRASDQAYQGVQQRVQEQRGGRQQRATSLSSPRQGPAAVGHGRPWAVPCAGEHFTTNAFGEAKTLAVCMDFKTKAGQAHQQPDGTTVHGYRCVAVSLPVAPPSDWFWCGHVPPPCRSCWPQQAFSNRGHRSDNDPEEDAEEAVRLSARPPSSMTLLVSPTQNFSNA